METYNVIPDHLQTVLPMSTNYINLSRCFGNASPASVPVSVGLHKSTSIFQDQGVKHSGWSNRSSPQLPFVGFLIDEIQTERICSNLLAAILECRIATGLLQNCRNWSAKRSPNFKPHIVGACCVTCRTPPSCLERRSIKHRQWEL